MIKYLLQINFNNSFSKFQKQKGFTLAEVLITLLVIGIVASLVIPALINDTNKAEYVTKLKKESAVLQQAFKLLAIDAGGSILNNPNFNCSGSSDYCATTASANAMNDFATKLNVVKNCGNDTGCWYASPIKYLSGTNRYNNLDNTWSNKYGKAILNDGTIIIIEIYGNSCTQSKGSAGTPLANSICGEIDIDINGALGPNKYGRDFFAFWLTKTGIYPIGTFGDGNSCNIDGNGFGCTAKVLSEGGMDY